MPITATPNTSWYDFAATLAQRLRAMRNRRAASRLRSAATLAAWLAGSGMLLTALAAFG